MSITLLLFELNWLLSYALSVSTASEWSCGIDPHLVNLRTWQCGQFFRLTLCVYVWFGGRHINSRKVRKCLPQFLVLLVPIIWWVLRDKYRPGMYRWWLTSQNFTFVNVKSWIHLLLWWWAMTTLFVPLVSSWKTFVAAYSCLKRGLFWSI